MRRRATFPAKVIGLLSLVLVWASASYFLNSDVLPGPLQVLDSGGRLLMDGTLAYNTLISLRRVLVGFCIGVGIGVALGFLVGLSWLASRTIYVFIEMLRPVPGIAWLPLAVLWLGLGEGSKYFLVAIGVFFPVFVGTVRGMRQTDPIHVRSAQALGASRWQIIRDVIFPSALPEILTGQRVGLSLGFIYMVAAELIGGQSGLGYMISYARIAGQPNHIYVGVLVIGALSLALGALQTQIDRHALRWHFGLEHSQVSARSRMPIKSSHKAL